MKPNAYNMNQNMTNSEILPITSNPKISSAHNSHEDLYYKQVSQYESNNKEYEYLLAIKKAEIKIKQLQIENATLTDNLDAAQEEITNLRHNIIPQNEYLKGEISNMKDEISNQLGQKERVIEQLSLELNQKEKLIQQLSLELHQMTVKQQEYQEQAQQNLQSGRRQSGMSNMSELTKSLQEITRLEQQIQEMRQQRLIQNQNYQKMLVKKDQIIKGMNQHYTQIQRVISTKLTLIKSMEQQINYLKNQLATNKHELSGTNRELTVAKENNKHLTIQVQKLNQKISQLNHEFNAKHQTSSTQLSHYKHELSLLKKDHQQSLRKTKQLQSQNQSLYNQNQQILKQYQTLKHQNIQQKQDLFTLNLQLQSHTQQSNQLMEQNKHLIDKLEQTRREVTHVAELQTNHSSVNLSKQIQLKQHYVELLEQSRKELTHNQIELKNTFNELQAKTTQLKIKENQITQLKLYQTYFQNTNRELHQDKTTLLNQIIQKDSLIRNNQNSLDQLAKQIYQLKKKIQQLQTLNKQNTQEKQQLLNKVQQLTQINQKNSPIQHFYDCNSEKQLLQQQLRDTKRVLTQQKCKSQSFLQQIHQLKNQLQLNPNKNPQKTYPKPQNQYQTTSQNIDHKIHSLKEQNKLLAQKLTERTLKLQEKSKKLEKVESQVKAQYQSRIKSLQKQVYKLTLLNDELQKNQPQNQGNKQEMLINPDDNLLIQDLDNELELQVSTQPKIGEHGIVKQLNEYDKINSKSHQNVLQTEQIPKSMQSLNSEPERPYKIMYEELKVQNDSLQAHLQRLSESLSQAKQQVKLKQSEIKKLQVNPKQLGVNQQIQLQENLKKVRQLQRQLSDAKEELERFESLKELLKLQKSESKQKSNTISQLQEKLSKLQKSHRELKEDYHNLQTLNQEANEKYKKTLEQFKKEMNQMNEEIYREKGNIDDKKKQMKRLQNEYIGKINLYEDENMSLRSKVKKLELANVKLQEKIKELEQEQIQKVIITRTQLVNYKQTEKRLEQLEEQINILLKDKDKFIGEKKAMELYYTEEIALIRNNFGNEREKMLRKITQLEEIRAQLFIKLEKTKEIFQTKRKQAYQFQQSLDKMTKENYHIKLELSSSLTELNTQLIRNKSLGEQISQLQNQINQIKMSYQGLVVEKSKNQKQKITKTGYKVELEMAYKQIQKLNDLLMDKEKQINYFLNYYPTNDHMGTKIPGFTENEEKPKHQYPSLQQHYENRPRKSSREYTYHHETTFTPQQYSESHYKSSKALYPKQTDFIKETNINYNTRPSYDSRPQNPQYQHRKTPQSQTQERLIGGFPAKFCTFAPEYHKI